jgi:hypothetical protein
MIMIKYLGFFFNSIYSNFAAPTTSSPWIVPYKYGDRGIKYREYRALFYEGH